VSGHNPEKSDATNDLVDLPIVYDKEEPIMMMSDVNISPYFIHKFQEDPFPVEYNDECSLIVGSRKRKRSILIKNS
jgi:hypothetical protein